MSNQRFASVWDAIEDTPEEAENMKLRSVLMTALKCVFRTKTASVPAGKRPPFRCENGRCSDRNAATIPVKMARTK